MTDIPMISVLFKWSGWVFDLLDNSEASSSVFLFDDMLSLVVPTATMFDIKGNDISRNL